MKCLSTKKDVLASLMANLWGRCGIHLLIPFYGRKKNVSSQSNFRTSPETEIHNSRDFNPKILHWHPVPFFMALVLLEIVLPGVHNIWKGRGQISLQWNHLLLYPKCATISSTKLLLFFVMVEKFSYSRAARLKIKCGSTQCKKKKKKCRVQVQLEILLNTVALIPSPDIGIWNQKPAVAKKYHKTKESLGENIDAATKEKGMSIGKVLKGEPLVLCALKCELQNNWLSSSHFSF